MFRHFYAHDPYLLYFSMYDQLSHPDCDGGPSCQRKNLHLQEADPLSELDRGAHQRYNVLIFSFVEQNNWDKPG